MHCCALSPLIIWSYPACCTWQWRIRRCLSSCFLFHYRQYMLADSGWAVQPITQAQPKGLHPWHRYAWQLHMLLSSRKGPFILLVWHSVAHHCLTNIAGFWRGWSVWRLSRLPPVPCPCWASMFGQHWPCHQLRALRTAFLCSHSICSALYACLHHVARTMGHPCPSMPGLKTIGIRLLLVPGMAAPVHADWHEKGVVSYLYPGVHSY
jgi:hypothetical protein